MTQLEPLMAARADSRVGQVSERVAALRALAQSPRLETERRIAALCDASSLLLDAHSDLGGALRRDLRTSTRLHESNIAWGLDTTLRTVTPDVLRALVHACRSSTRCHAVPHELVAVVLAGNVFSSALRALWLPLLAGANVIAKPASADDALAWALKHALDRVDAELGERLQLVNFSRDDDAATQALLAHADAVSAYGDDSSLRALAARCGADCHFIAHGHGLSAAYISRTQLSDRRRARDSADRLALDIAAYDQRGCLSPQVAFVESGAAITPQAFAKLLADESLPLLAELLPPGRPDATDRAASLQWRAVAAARGDLYATATHAVSYEAHQAPRPSPGDRQISIYACANESTLSDTLGRFATHLKCIGIAGPKATHRQVAKAVSKLAAISICPLGQMQTPAFDNNTDGNPPLTNLYKHQEAD